MEKNNISGKLHAKKMESNWVDNLKKYNVGLQINGLSSISSYSFIHKDALKFKTFLTQEFLKKGYLATASFYASTAHHENIIDNYSEILDEIFLKLKNV